MKTSQQQQSSGDVHRLYHQPVQQIEPYHLSQCEILNNVSDNGSQGTPVYFASDNEQFFTLESSPAINYIVYDSPSAVSISSNRISFSPQCSQSYISDLHHSPDNTYGSPLSGCSVVDNDNNGFKHVLRELENQLLGPDSDLDESSSCSFNGLVPKASSLERWNQKPILDLKLALIACAEAVSELNESTSGHLMKALEGVVSISGEPIQRLGAYMLEGLRARMLASGSRIYKKLKCKEPTGPELMSYMHFLYQIVPYYQFAYTAANVIIKEAMQNENRIHIIDFQIAQGSQWVFLMQELAVRPGGPLHIRVTGVDDSESTHARGGGLQLVGQRLSKVAESCGVQFEFHAAGMSGCDVELENLCIRHGEALAVNFPYMLHHMPDESVNTTNHRDRLLRLVKSLSPKVVVLVEQESNTNTTAFVPRFRETLDYYTAMFESIDAARPRDDKQRISAEEHCVARDIVNIIACEGAERVERHELFGKWRLRLMMAGYTACPLSNSVGFAVKDKLKEFSPNFRLEQRDGALYLGWKNRALVTCSAWR